MVNNGKVRPKKALGQHFLTDESVSRRIADTLSGYVGTPVIEVGPGMGMLTKYLIADGHDVTVVEIDGESIDYLRKNFPQLQGERIINGDFLQMDLADKMGYKPFCVIGNYPYNISSQIFFKVLDNRERIPVVAGMLQKEVAERICTGPGSKVYGILSVLLQAWYDCEYLFSVEPSVFAPPPKVRSGVLRLTRNSRTSLGCDPALFRRVVKTAFGQRRKTLRNSLAPLIPPGSPALLSELMPLRPERLSVDQFIELTNLIATKS